MIIFSDSSSLYLYSALLQANAAIFALLGVYIIFSIQSYRSSIDIIKSTIYSDRGMASTPTRVAQFESLSFKEKKISFSQMNREHYYYKLYENWLYYLEKNNDLRKIIVIPSVLLIIGISLDVLSLIFSSNIHLYHSDFEVYQAYIIGIYHIVIWSVITWEIIKIVKSD